MSREWTVESLVASSQAYWTSSAIIAAVKLDIFSVLAEKPLPLAAMVEKTGLPERGLTMLVRTLLALNLLRMTDAGIALTEFSREHLCRDGKGYVGHIIMHFSHLQECWAHLSEVIQGKASNVKVKTDDERESFLMGMVNMADLRADNCVPELPLSKRKKVLDLGGGPGGFSVQFCHQFPDVSVTLFDLPTTKPYAERYIASHNLQSRIEFVAGDFLADQLPQGFDAAWLSQILHGQNSVDAAMLVKKAYDSLNPGGLLLIHEFIVNDDFKNCEFPALFGLNMLVNTVDGQSYTESELTAMMVAAGITDIKRLNLDLPKGRGVLVGVK